MYECLITETSRELRVRLTMTHVVDTMSDDHSW